MVVSQGLEVCQCFPRISGEVEVLQPGCTHVWLGQVHTPLDKFSLAHSTWIFWSVYIYISREREREITPIMEHRMEKRNIEHEMETGFIVIL